jgi:glutathione S-transferase
VDLPKNLIIHGNIVDNQTRSLMGACSISGQHYQLQEVDTFKGENKVPRYLSINPTGHIPLIEDGPYKVLGGNHLVYVYICKSKAPVASKLMPPELEGKIKGVIGWNIAKMMTPCQ